MKKYLIIALLFASCTATKRVVKIDTTGFGQLSEPIPSGLNRGANDLLLPPNANRRNPHQQTIEPMPTPVTIPVTTSAMKVLVWMDIYGGTLIDNYWNGGLPYTYVKFIGDTASIIRGARSAYAKWNVDFTYSKPEFDAWTKISSRYTHCIITSSSSLGRSPATPTGTPYQSGVSWVGSAIMPGTSKVDWVFPDIIYNNTWYITAIVVHEVGHTLGLSHQAGLINGSCATYGNGFYMGQAWSGGIFVDMGYYPGNCIDRVNSDIQKLNTNVGIR